ncbi:MASE1 domain-containing protein [Flavobacterium sp. 5]|uniref:MASE1 domain-containing protein n=1 Tax=Flavobacterium sp. 5 TaxID=2035199 RepID=UPI000C2C8B25|nr:MASE1 domain-containing protein [Flavobacterium sp. 5]PKB17107.1 PAS domain S-box-containing protein [Flavobacterium sp. 5]
MKSNHSLTSFYSEPTFLRSTPVVILLVAALYILLAKLSFLLSIAFLAVSPLFPASGLSLAAVLILGNRALPGIFIGAFLSNILNNLNVQNLNNQHLLTIIFAGFFIGLGNVIASIISKYIIINTNKKNHPLYNGKNILILLISGSITYATITSSIGVITLTIGGFITKEHWYVFQTWWLGDIVGIILVTPVFLSWYLKDSFEKKKFKILELLLFGAVVVLVCYIVFFKHFDLKYIIIAILFWAVYRFGTQITTLIILIISSFAIITTVKGIGPFSKDSINNSILSLDLFLCFTAICSLFLSSILDERQRAKNLTKISRKKLQKSESILESIIESPKDVSIYSIGRNYEYLNFNSLHKNNIKAMNSIEITLGMTLQESLVNIEELNDAVAVLDKVFLGESVTTIRQFDFNGSYWEFRTSPIINEAEEIIGATVISTNITEKIKIEEALINSEKKYRDIFTNIQHVIFQIDLNSIFLNISPSVKDIIEYTPKELIGRHSRILDIDDDDTDLVHYIITEKKNLINHEKMIKTKSGLLKTISLNAKLIYNKDGTPDHIDAIAQDITERKENEQKIASQNQKLQIQNKELEQFAYITSHDLQEPLLTLKYFTELLKNDHLKDHNEEEQEQYLNFIFESSDRMQKLVKGLLDYSRIGKQVEISKEDCNEIVNNAISTLTNSIEKTKANIHIDKLPTVNGYFVELIQLFKHLIANSIEFRKKEVPLEINISAIPVGNNWQITVQDNGIGIEEHNLEKIFIIFKRLNNREEYSGIGLSLAICKKIIALHGGNIWAESSFGHGTTIFFTIPKININEIS